MSRLHQLHLKYTEFQHNMSGAYHTLSLVIFSLMLLLFFAVDITPLAAISSFFFPVHVLGPQVVEMLNEHYIDVIVHQCSFFLPWNYSNFS